MDFNGRTSPQGLTPYFCESKKLSVIPVLEMVDDILTNLNILGSLCGSDFLQSILSSVLQEKN